MKNKLFQYTVIMLIAIGGTLLTGWQIQRGGAKLSSLQHEAIEKSQNDVISEADHLNQLNLSGTFLKDLVLYQPRSNQYHQSGYQVWVPFKTINNTILVSLGFQKDILIPSTQKIRGTIYYIKSPPIRLSDPAISRKFPQLVAQLDLERFRQITKLPLSSYVLVIDGADDQALASPSLDQALKHFSYAGQFFIITCILCYYILRQKNISNAPDI